MPAPDQGATQLRTAVLERLHEDRDRIVRVAWSALLAEVPEYAGLTELQREDVRTGVEAIFDLFLSCVTEGRGLTVEDLMGMQELGAARARQDLPRALVERGFHAAFESCSRHLLRATAARDPAGQHTDVTAELAGNLTDLAVNTLLAIRSGHAQETGSLVLSQVQWEHATVESLLDKAAKSVPPDRSGPAAPIRPPIAMLVMTPLTSSPVSALRTTCERLLESLPGVVRGPVRERPRPHAIALVGGVDVVGLEKTRNHLAPLARELGFVTVLECTDRSHELGRTYRHIRDCLHLAPCVADDSAIVEVTDLRMWQVLDVVDMSTSGPFVRDTLGAVFALPDSQRTILLETLTAMTLGNGSTADIARRLDLSLKGAAYRLRRLGEFTQLNPSVPADRFWLELASWFLRRNVGDLLEDTTMADRTPSP